MPIYEFKCSKCEEFFEVIVMASNDNDTVACPKCESNEYERVVSKTNFAMGSSSSGQTAGVQTQERECSGGSCKTYTVPGETK
ncbi:MAG: zinc ribbon domain-containing protein [Desulfobacula sp.]|jgi:putative FmdB family regulatory protein|uniref:FmdB family zinc ribbon protein n=1 Tax=Desulfobacula sp. TaxID=2593537 RepID=UPI001D9CD50A|nr:zinc ribbon domain-containing protein [Desulfobacula sp.]MBT3486328.1 zinc ribbon domain-containing protein [Desulfobacula sp.]MBT3805885.1 zinc ribbon domain-containing protein [Desulfobacula sp.]MBT4026311.1 zinc ribbon domain-containing protein [Desulfobacula sp.]MBT4198071.1 zinc ribbon domain-containing protein [Desulfobacula sp.]